MRVSERKRLLLLKENIYHLEREEKAALKCGPCGVKIQQSSIIEAGS